jgi:hypothetical protein
MMMSIFEKGNPIGLSLTSINMSMSDMDSISSMNIISSVHIISSMHMHTNSISKKNIMKMKLKIKQQRLFKSKFLLKKIKKNRRKNCGSKTSFLSSGNNDNNSNGNDEDNLVRSSNFAVTAFFNLYQDLLK